MTVWYFWWRCRGNLKVMTLDLLSYQFSLTHLYISRKRLGECNFLFLGMKELNPGQTHQTPNWSPFRILTSEQIGYHSYPLGLRIIWLPTWAITHSEPSLVQLVFIQISTVSSKFQDRYCGLQPHIIFGTPITSCVSVWRRRNDPPCLLRSLTDRIIAIELKMHIV